MSMVNLTTERTHLYNQVPVTVRWSRRGGGPARPMLLRPGGWTTMTLSAEKPGSITRRLQGLKAGRADGVEAMWRRYDDRALAVARLRQGPHQAVKLIRLAWEMSGDDKRGACVSKAMDREIFSAVHVASENKRQGEV